MIKGILGSFFLSFVIRQNILLTGLYCARREDSSRSVMTNGPDAVRYERYDFESGIS